MQTHWRPAVMFDAPGHDLAALETALRRSPRSIRAAAARNRVRLGVADHYPDLDCCRSILVVRVAGTVARHL